MKRLGSLWPRVSAFDNLLLAWRKARRGKHGRAAVARFGLELESGLLRLQEDLRSDAYQPGPYRQFTLYERKPRLISAAPFRDRVVHHAIMNVIEPALDPGFIHDCYACRAGRGVHAAVDRYQRWARRFAYVMKADIQRYFPSVDHDILKAKLRRRLKDAQLLALLDRIIDSGAGPPADPLAITGFVGDDLFTHLERPRGIPIGNLTSQFFANFYLDELDHSIKQCWKAPAYLRYVDDLVFLADDKLTLWTLADRLAQALADLRLRVHPTKLQVMRTSERVDMLGYRVSPTRRWLRNDNGFRFLRRLRGMAKAYAMHQQDLCDFDGSIQAWIGHARHGETAGLRTVLFDSVTFARII